MFYRQVIGLLKRVRVSAQTISATTCRSTISSLSIPKTSNTSISCQYNSDFSTRSMRSRGIPLWILIYGQVAILVGINGTVAFAEDDQLELGKKTDREANSFSDLRRIEDGSVISNIHTSKWRVFTDKGKNLSMQGKLEEAERYFVLALEEAKEGFGEKDPHVASACNNLAELYRVKKAFVKAGPLYLKAVKILEESFGPEDVRVGAAFHNLGQFYLVQRKLEEAHIYYEQALKIKGRVLGHGHADYADTMYHLGTVMYLEGKERDSETLILNSIKILEEGGQGESIIYLRRLRHLSQIYLKHNRLAEAENVQRKILHIMELSKGWNSLDTVIAAERLAWTLESIGHLKEARDLLLQCLNARKTILPEDHIQIGANMLHMARVAVLNVSQLTKVNISEASDELDEAKGLLNESVRITRQYLNGPTQKRNLKDVQAALVIMLQAFIALGLLESSKQKIQEPREDSSCITAAEHAYRQCISAFKEVESGTLRPISNSPDVQVEYLSCLKHLIGIIRESRGNKTKHLREGSLQEMEDEIKHIETDLTRAKRS